MISHPNHGGARKIDNVAFPKQARYVIVDDDMFLLRMRAQCILGDKEIAFL